MDFRILGSLEVWDGERQLDLGGAKRRLLLALLLLHANEVVAADQLVDQLWGERAPGNAAGALQSHVSRLRKELGPDVVGTRAWGYVLRVKPGALDLDRFERLSLDAENLPAGERAGKLREALALWRGSPLADLAFEPSLAGAIARLEELRLTVLENRIDADLESGHEAGLVGELEALITTYPLRERLRAQLILALYRSGRQAEALEVYRETRRVLADELGLEPSPELRELERAILQQDPALRASPVRATVAAVPGVRPGRRRRIYIAACLAILLLAGLGIATSYALTASTTQAAELTTSAFSLTFPTTAAATYTHTATHPRNATDEDHSETRPVHERSSAAPRTTKHSSARPSTTVGNNAHKDKKHRPVTSHPKLITIADDFPGSTLNALIWNPYYGGTGSSLAVGNGQLVFSIAGNATFDPQYHWAGSGIKTTCIFPGAFDARIDYKLLQWPQEGSTLAVVAYGGGNVEQIQRISAPWGNGYNGGPNGVGGTVVPFPDQTGSLRLSRSHGIVRSEFLHNNRWTVIDRIASSVPIDLEVSVFSGPNSWQQQDISAAVENFVVTAPRADCPPGSNP
jgi:DNA-binding SARP family transcriptional activator